MTVDGFSLTKHSLSQRTESALKSLVFSSPLHPLPPCPNRDELSCSRRNGLHTHTPSERKKSVESLQDIHWQSKSISLLQGSHYGAVGRGAYQMETTVLCQLRFDPATMREPSMEMSCDGMPLKINSLLSFISEFSALKLSGPRCIKSPYVTGSATAPPPPKKKALWKGVAKM